MRERLFKCLKKGRIGPFSNFKWPRCGVWVKAEGPLSVCQNGIHLCREKDLVEWLNEEICEAEYRGDERIDSGTKIVVREARLTKRLKAWNEKTARLFVCDCAERALSIYEKKYPNDKRPRHAIEISRKYANKKATKEELAAARGAAWAAAWAAARGAAWAAAWAAARDAAWAAARAAAGDAAGAAERKWQTKRLMEYLYPKENRNPAKLSGRRGNEF